MNVSPGDIDFKTFTIGGLNLNDPNKAKKLEFNVYYDILTPIVTGDVEVLDENDAMGTYNFRGNEDVYVSFTVPGGETVSLNFVTFQNANVSDNTLDNKGSGKHKTYTFKLVSPELIRNRDNHFSESFYEPTHSMVRKALKTISAKKLDTPDETKVQRQYANYVTVFNFVEQLRNVHVSQQYKSSAYVLYPTYDSGTEKYVFCTFEYLMSKGSKFEYKQDSTVGARSTTDGDQMKNILWCEIPSTFNSATIAGSASNKNNYNLQTGVQKGKDNKDSTYITLGDVTAWKPQIAQSDSVTVLSKPPTGTTGKVGVIDPANDPQKTGVADAVADRKRFLAYLSQNTIKFEVHGNPNIKIGDVVTLKLPKKADAGQDDGEKQINDKVLIVKIRHRVLPEGNKPRYTMIIEAIKAGYK